MLFSKLNVSNVIMVVKDVSMEAKYVKDKNVGEKSYQRISCNVALTVFKTL